MVCSTVLSAGLVLVLSSMADAHIALYDKGMFGYNYPWQSSNKTQNYNTNSVVAPLREYDNLTVSDWFAHGYQDYPPVEGDFMELVSGSNYTGELGCNRALTHMRNPASTEDFYFHACPDKGTLHTAQEFNEPVDNKWFGGTALAIAYTSDEQTVGPGDFTVFSVNYTAAWYRETVYQIPSGMPKCPKKGCLCTWNWWHLSGHGEGYGNEFYNVLYRCTISGDTSDSVHIPIGQAAAPKLCSNSTNCNPGAKQPLYAFMVSGNNISPRPSSNPTYNQRYSFSDGAQTDIFTEGGSSGGFALAPSVWLASVAAVLVASIMAMV